MAALSKGDLLRRLLLAKCSLNAVFIRLLAKSFRLQCLQSRSILYPREQLLAHNTY